MGKGFGEPRTKEEMRAVGFTHENRRTATTGSVKVAWVSPCANFQLNQRQKIFCDTYIASGMKNAHEAYVAAGYKGTGASAKSSAYGLLQKPAVREYIKLHRDQYKNQVLVTQDYVVENLKGVVQESKNDAARVAALKQLGQFLGMWVERTEVTGKDGGPVGFADASNDLSGVSEENLQRIKELLSAQKSDDDGDRLVN